MSQRTFPMRLRCRYEGSDNTPAGLEVEHQVEGAWQPFDLGVRTPGFEIFVYAVLTCQHMYFRVNCAERGLVLASAEGDILAATDGDWTLQTLAVHFSGRLARGTPTDDDIQYIAARMRQCPVSRNLRDVSGASTRVELA